MTEVKVGSKVWTLRTWSHERIWDEREITGETSRSWLIEIGRFTDKIPKRHQAGQLRTWAFAPEECAELDWLDRNRYRIGERVQRLTDPATLREVARLTGYEERP